MNSSTHVLIFLTIAGVMYGSESAPTTSTPTSLTTKVKDAIEKTEVTLKQAISIVEKRRLTECVARTICELACNPDSKSYHGVKVGDFDVCLLL
jgi:hypothetical protein